MTKPAICICTCESKGADQLCRAFVFSTYMYIDIIVQLHYFLNPKFQASSCTARFASDLVGNPKENFSSEVAHTISRGCNVFCFVVDFFFQKRYIINNN